MCDYLIYLFGLGIGVIISLGGIFYAIDHFAKVIRYMKVVSPFEVEGNKGHRKSWVERFLDASDIADECKRCL